jgi:hypothetical protein
MNLSHLGTSNLPIRRVRLSQSIAPVHTGLARNQALYSVVTAIRALMAAYAE